VERVCDRVGFIRKGKLIDVREIADLKEHAIREIEIIFAAPVEKEQFSGLPGIKDVRVKGVLLTCTVAGSLDAVIKAAAKFEVVDVVSREPNLEDLFLTYYGGEQNAAS
jgi:ABC-2 type transport system ATP-binding protein